MMVTLRTPNARGPQLIVAALVAVVVAVALIYIAFGLLTAGPTLGCDYFTYADAAARHVRGGPVYPIAAARTGDCGLYQYPPPFLLLLYPFIAFGHDGLWLWIVMSAVAFAVGCLILPVQRWIRLTILLLGAIGWPFIFGLRIGQVVPLLYLLFAVGWRFLDRPIVVGIASGLGAIVKVQPGLVVLWLAARLRFRAIAVAAATVALAVVLAATVGLADWGSFLRVVRDISQAVDVPANMSIGATLYRFGTDASLASVVQTANAIGLLILLVVAGRSLGSAPGYLLAVTASQIISPILWSHYALILLLPVAWLLDRRQWWALIIPVSHAWMLIEVAPAIVYTLPYYVVIAALVVMGRQDGRAPRNGAPIQQRPEVPA